MNWWYQIILVIRFGSSFTFVTVMSAKSSHKHQLSVNIWLLYFELEMEGQAQSYILITEFHCVGAGAGV